MKIFITGPAGSGKSTHAKMLARKFSLHYISGGDLARKKAADNSEEGKAVKEAIETGRLIDDEVEARLVSNEIEKSPEKYVLDGFPRSLHQLGYLEPDIDAVIIMEVPDEEVKRRLLKRGRA
ncbi:MAG: Adenylate kinase, partial [Candidatus Daviesbacteria bacterium GW2011_GWB1_41_5]